MQELGIILWAVVVIALLNVAMVALTLGVKAIRTVHKRRTRASIEMLEAALDESLATGVLRRNLLWASGTGSSISSPS